MVFKREKIKRLISENKWKKQANFIVKSIQLDAKGAKSQSYDVAKYNKKGRRDKRYY